MVDYYPLPKNHKQSQTELEGEEHEVPEPLIVDFVYNELDDRHGKTIAIKVSFCVPRHRPGVPAANK
jgi:hypothetical protein